MATSSVALWQHPFVDVFKHVATVRMETIVRGDVEQIMDKHIRKNVYRLRGKIAASNYLRIPKDSNVTSNMHLTGRFVYVELRRVHGDSVTFHLEVLTMKKSMLRFTFSSIYSSTRSMGVNLRIPLMLTDKWTVLALDMYQLLDLHTSVSYNREGYAALKAISLCSSMFVRGIYTSDILYLPETLPKSMQFPLVKPADGIQASNSWDVVYDWRWLPQLPSAPTPTDKLISTAIDTLGTTATNQSDAHDVRPPAFALQIDTSHHPPLRRASSNQSASPSPRSRSPSRLFSKLTPDDCEAQLHGHRVRVLDKADTILQEAGIHRQSPVKSSYVKAKYLTATGVYTPTKYSRHANFSGKNTTLWPTPVATLDRVVGFSCGHRDAVVWAHNASTFAFACESTVVVGRRTEDDHGGHGLHTQELLLGHTDDITTIAYSPASGLLASAQSGATPLVRLWALAPKGHCVATINAHAGGVLTLAFNPSGQMLSGVGKDAKQRVQLLVWDISTTSPPASKLPPPTLVAKQLCDVAISKLKFSPHEPDRLVSCGRESIRFWRIKAGHLPSCPVVLHEYARDVVFTDVDFDPIVLGNQTNRPVYVASTHGTVLVVDYDTMALTCVYKLHDGPIRGLRVNEGFCVTGSDDGFLRVWPLDFTDFYLEAQHDAGVVALDLSPDGLHALVGCVNGTIGVLDISSQAYTTVVRAHTDRITHLLTNPRGDAFVTASHDHTIRVWDMATGIQTVEFKTADAVATSLAHHPRKDRLAVGFSSGILRLFDIESMEVLETYQQHMGAVEDVRYGRSACYSTGVDQQLCCYQANATTVHMVNCAFPPGGGTFHLHVGLKILAVAGKDAQSIEIRDMYSLRHLRSVVAPSKPTAASTMPPLRVLGFVHTQLVAMDASQRVLLCCATTGCVLQTYPSLCNGPLGHVVFTASGQHAITGRVDQTQLQVVLLETTQQLRALQMFSGQASGLRHVDLAAGGQHIVSCGAGAAVYLWQFHGPPSPETPRDAAVVEVDDDDEHALYEAHRPFNDYDDADDVPNALVPTPIQPPTKREVRPTQDILTCEPTFTAGWNVDAQVPVVWSDETNVLVSASGAALLVETRSGSQRRIRQHRHSVQGLSLAHDGRSMASHDGITVCVWRLAPWTLVAEWHWPHLTQHAFLVWAPLDNEILGVAMTAAATTTLLVWAVETNEVEDEAACVAQTTLSSGSIRQAVWMHDPNQRLPFAFCTNAPFRGWNIDRTTHTLISVPFLDECPVAWMQTSASVPDHVLVYTPDCAISFYNVHTHTLAGTAPLHKRHTVQHLHWLTHYIVVATDTAPCLWVYTVCPQTFRLTLHTSTTPDSLEIHTIRVNRPITRVALSAATGKGLVLTSFGTLWYVDVDAHTKQLLRRVHAIPIHAAAASADRLATIAGTTVRLWDTQSLHEVAYAVVAGDDANRPVCVDVNVSGCVVGCADGSFRVWDLSLGMVVHEGAASWSTMETNKTSGSTKGAPPMHQVKYLGDSASVILATATGHCALFHVPTKHLQRLPLPFGATQPHVLSSQNDVKVGGTLLHVATSKSSAAATSMWLVLWQSKSAKCYVNAFTNVTTAQDAWELTGTTHGACAVFAPSHETMVLYVANGMVEGRCVALREVIFRCVVGDEALPTSMHVYMQSSVLCHTGDGTMYILDVEHERLFHATTTFQDNDDNEVERGGKRAVFCTIPRQAHVIHIQGNRLSTMQLTVGGATTATPRR
ncbi:Aste57867_20150 [Aphanomyces stellatus]|uniref:Aste57867_20150 protein n=1 Tax=Aphanomyces stellatus TaxID=120398 RepID=A0A485LFU9_9STRA|nr:hypothetical protein As57867_020084 [Aphanomyces stellatus]VFT96845.1 Aste57867_20150 [Aphanomyces stellatus]